MAGLKLSVGLAMPAIIAEISPFSTARLCSGREVHESNHWHGVQQGEKTPDFVLNYAFGAGYNSATAKPGRTGQIQAPRYTAG